MSIINDLLKKENITADYKQKLIKAFIREHLIDNPELLPELTEAVLKDQKIKMETLQQQQFNLGLNFISVKELLTEGETKHTQMQSFSGLLNQPKMEDDFDKVIKNVIDTVKVVKK